MIKNHSYKGMRMSKKIKFLMKNNEFADTFINLVKKSESIYISSAWVTENHEPFEILYKNKGKIKRFFCGIENYLTSPEVLKKFREEESFRIIAESQLFHHKVYLFNYKDNKGVTRWESLIGSANLTRAGVYNNFELIQHTVYDELINLHNDLEKRLFDLSISFSDEFIINYEKNYELALKDKIQRDLVNIYKSNKFFNLSWENFFNKVKNDQFHSLSGRLKLLELAKKLLSNKKFIELSLEERKLIAGTSNSNFSIDEGFDTKWFGGMSGAGHFCHNVIEKPMPISDAIDMIPKSGKVTKEDYQKFIAKMIPASGYENDPISICTRILAMVRPDYFFCVTSANRSKLSDDLNFLKSNLSINNYWDLVVEPLINSEWWNSEEHKSDLEKRVWKNRIALLDILYYAK